MKETEIAYLAGLFDGDGSVGIARVKQKSGHYCYQTAISISQVRKPCVEAFSILMGAKLSVLNHKRKNGQQPMWRCQVHGAKAAKVISIMRPYMIGKADQADLLLEFQENCTFPNPGRNGYPAEVHELRAKYYERMKELHRRVFSE